MILSNGLTLVAINPNCAIDLTGSNRHGWLFVDRSKGYISERKLDSWEIMQAEGQDHYAIVQGYND